MVLSRAEFNTLWGGDRVRFDARARRGQLPFFVTNEASLARRNYSASDVFDTMLVDQLNDRLGMPLDTACGLIVKASGEVRSRWAAVSKSSADLLAGRDTRELFCGGAQVQTLSGRRVTEHWLPVAGSYAEIVKHLQKFPPVAVIALVNLTRTAAELRTRAIQHEIDIADFWE